MLLPVLSATGLKLVMRWSAVKIGLEMLVFY